MDHKINLRLGPAKDTLAELINLNESYDFIYIDADKANLEIYYEQSLQLLRSGGLIDVDNVLWGGRVIDECHQEYGPADQKIAAAFAKPNDQN